MKLVKLFIFTIVFVVILAVVIAYSGIYDVSASSPHSGFTRWLASTAMHSSVERQAKGIAVPDLNDKALQLAGINDFDTMCKSCHGAPGQSAQAVGQGLNPPAPDLKESATQMTSAELFWVTKHGIRMTGMPSWGATHEDDALWPVVAFVKELPSIDADRYQSMLESAQGMGHHAPADDHNSETGPHNDSEDHAHDAVDSSNDVTGDGETEHDHSTHNHDDGESGA